VLAAVDCFTGASCGRKQLPNAAVFLRSHSHAHILLAVAFSGLKQLAHVSSTSPEQLGWWLSTASPHTLTTSLAQ
jgi:hypothetical protein